LPTENGSRMHGRCSLTELQMAPNEAALQHAHVGVTVKAAAVWTLLFEALEAAAFFVAAAFFALMTAFQALTTFGLWRKWCSDELNSLLVRGVPFFLACAHSDTLTSTQLAHKR